MVEEQCLAYALLDSCWGDNRVDPVRRLSENATLAHAAAFGDNQLIIDRYVDRCTDIGPDGYADGHANRYAYPHADVDADTNRYTDPHADSHAHGIASNRFR